LNSTAIVIVIIVFGLLAAVFVLSSSSRRDQRAATGQLSRETRGRDRSNPVLEELAEQEGGGPTGREVERAAQQEWRGGGAVVVAAKPAPPAIPAPLDPEALGVTRRQFFNRGIVAMFGLGLAGFGGSMLAFMWGPSQSGGFGAKINAGSLSALLNTIAITREPVYVPEARTYIQAYPTDHIASASKVYTGPVLDGMKEGVVALYQKCVHLGCRVPWCKASQWFECPCHGSKYNRVGEKKGGPAPRGLDRFGVVVDGGNLYVDTKTVVLGPSIGTNTTGQEAEGPHCA
jgi:cytochrome b6-f complex iron-sulfur subunit